MILAYFIGSIPFGLVVTKLAGKGDLRQSGSGNVGATNVFRQEGKKLALLTFLLDMLKGFVFTYALRKLGHTPADIVVGCVSIAAHMFPIYLRFHGGKGVATAMGVFLGWSWWLGLGVICAWGIVLRLTKTSSIAGMCSVMLSCFLSYIFMNNDPDQWFYVTACFAITLMIIWAHRDNIKRIISGQEKKIIS